MAAVPGQQALGAGAAGGHGGDPVGGLGRSPAGLRIGALAHDAERLAGAGEGRERVRDQVAGGDAARQSMAASCAKVSGQFALTAST